MLKYQNLQQYRLLYKIKIAHINYRRLTKEARWSTKVNIRSISILRYGLFIFNNSFSKEIVHQFFLLYLDISLYFILNSSSKGD